MREIKYRAWHKNKQRMYKVESIHFEDEYLTLLTTSIYDSADDLIKCKLSDVEIMQYTGLNDKKGVEICEEDIIEDDSEFYIVHWDEKSCGFEPFSDSKENCGCCGGGKSSTNCYVRGNIHQNPELLVK